jgi:glutathione S-transferase
VYAGYHRRLVSATLYVIPGSTNAIIARLMLDHKGIAYREVELGQALHTPLIYLRGFPSFKPPSLSTDGRRLHGTFAIAAGLEEIQPEPALFPADPEDRVRVEEAQRWGEETLPGMPGRMHSALRERVASGEGNPLIRVPGQILSLGADALTWLEARVPGRGEPTQRALAELSAALDHVDELIAGGVIGGPEPNAADFHIAARIRDLMNVAPVRPLVADRPAGRHAMIVCPLDDR